MRLSIGWMVLTSMFCATGFLSQSPSLLAAPDHVVSPTELQQAAVAAARTRQANVAKVKKFFSTPQAEKALKSARLDPVQIKQAIPSLSNKELAHLAARADKAQRDLAAGALTNQQITYILIALATAVVVLIAT